MIDIEAIKARAAKATVGPWTVEKPMDNPAIIANGNKQAYDWDFIAHIETGGPKQSVKADRNADFIAHSRTDIPALCAEVERLTALLKMAEQALEFYSGLDAWRKGVNSAGFECFYVSEQLENDQGETARTTLDAIRKAGVQ